MIRKPTTQGMPGKVKLSIGFLILLILIAITKPLLIGELPVLLKNDQGWQFFPSQADSEANSQATWVLYPLIPLSEKNIDLNRRLLAPMSVSEKENQKIRHWAGTDHLGRDMCAGLISGIRYALLIGFGVIFISLILGIVTGSAAGWYGDHMIKWSFRGLAGRLIYMMVSFIFLVYYLDLYHMQVITFRSVVILLSGIGILGWLLFHFLRKIDQNRRLDSKWIKLPLDSIITKIIEWFSAIPGLLLILAMSTIVKQQDTWTMIALISFLSWPLTARLVRSEVMRRKYLPYLHQEQHIETPFFKVLLKQLLPNIWTSLIIVAAFGFASVIMLDATLSFLGLGLPLEQVNFGNQLGGIKRHPEAWWLVVFPGVMIAGILMSLNVIGSWVLERSGTKGRILRWF